MDGFLVVVAIVFIMAIIFSLPFGYAAYVRKLHHIEMMAMIEKGIVETPGPQASGNGKGSLRWGIVITALGLALSLGLYPFGFLVPATFPLFFGPWMVIGLIPLFFGLSLIVVYQVTKEKEEEQQEETDNE